MKNNKEKKYAFISEDRSLTGIYEGKENLPDQPNNPCKIIKIFDQDEGESFLNHAQGLLELGYTFPEMTKFLDVRAKGNDKKNPIYYVVFSKRYSGVFSKAEIKLIPEDEPIALKKKFYLLKSAINYFEENESLYQYGPFYVVNSVRISGIFTDIDKIHSFIANNHDGAVIKECDNLTMAEAQLKNHQEKSPNPSTFIVVIAQHYSGIFNTEERKVIPKGESIYYEKRFESPDEAIRDFDKNEPIYRDKAYYVIQSNQISGIFTETKLVEPFIKHGIDVKIEKHKTLKEAQQHFQQLKANEQAVIAYVDGSYCTTTMLSGYAYLLITHQRIIFENKGASFCDNDMRHLNGELEAVMNCILKAIELGFKKIIIRYDAAVIFAWSNKESRHKQSSSSRMLSKRYFEFITRARAYIEIEFEKITAHNHRYYNDRVDFLAKQAAGNRQLDIFFKNRNAYFS
ncbi:hypothetical protein E4665_15875 [Sporolactobacillus shoreae]|uniref:RNase H type-1 domain-containing protein n=1 Tax=Sporolactobacillus shoreae TaxID=1465501 RepID=A0A4Z0GHY2_9BACL|nr:RNase H family protein [Sporolactobacillus shoreae]TGA96342.1 hypothetical protein E4665_15875 [Sporolactobacillus shoreae]